ncbi:MAG: nucleotidyltransferase domain-containing protein [Treponema sp.]|nr:nucleotidyltransferase domain-containing protein [Treponema sp.]
MSEQAHIQQTLTEYFSHMQHIDTVLLFGSFAKGTITAHSDIDIAIHSETTLDYAMLSKIQTELALLCHREIDITDLSKAEGIFLYQIMTSGVKIKIAKSIFVQYLMKALCFKEDFLPTVERFQKEKIRRFMHG